LPFIVEGFSGAGEMEEIFTISEFGGEGFDEEGTTYYHLLQ